MQHLRASGFEQGPSLQASIVQAVTAGRRAATEIESKVLAVRGAILQAVQTLATLPGAALGVGETDAGSIADSACGMMARAQAGMHETFLRRSSALGHVNLVLFGRTGVGKSTLIEALTSGDGRSVSQGESDWTVDVRPVTWHACRLVDTPGINGWGRTERRADLEEKARQAVEAADIVLLCFDTQSQQEAEFSKVAEWVQAYGKPAIAIINNRNAVWRNPTRESRRHRRANLSRTMLQHEGNVRDGLASQGFGSVPVVCLSAKRALLARAKQPFCGPDANTMASQRALHGEETLLSWSNLPALESLLIEALTQDAPGIRLGMLVASLRGDLAQLAEMLAGQATAARARADILDLAIDRVLCLLGYPEENAPARRMSRDGGGPVDYLAWLEESRGGRFTAPSQGAFKTYVGRVLVAALGRAQAVSLERAEVFVMTAFSQKVPVDQSAFAEEVYDLVAIQKAGESVTEAATAFLTDSLDLLDGDLRFDLAALQVSAARINGTSGAWWRQSATGAHFTTMALGLGGTILVLSTAAAPVILLAGLGITVASMITGWFGDHAARKAETKRASERRAALAAARRSVNATFDGFAEAVADAAAASGRTALSQVLHPLLREAVACHLVLQQVSRVRQVMEEVDAVLPRSEPGRILLDAAARVEAARYPGQQAAGRLIWAGEDWVDDPVGLDLSRNIGVAMAEPGIPVPFWQVPADPRLVGAGKAFVAWAEDRLGDFVSAAAVMTELRALAALDGPAIFLLGDYNAGKTSFIKRLFAEAGLPVPTSLTVRADPTTPEVTRYDLHGARLVDTPGLQSVRDGDNADTVEAVVDASIVVWLLHGSVLDTSLKHLAAVLRGDVATGRAGKAARTLLVLGRADELGRDPNDDPEEYRRTIRRKTVEIIQALRSHGVSFPESRLFAVSADPFGQVGDVADVTARNYDSGRSWDGIAGFLAGLDEALTGDGTLSLIDAAILEGALARLTSFDGALAAQEAARRAEVEQTAGLVTVVDGGIKEGKDLLARLVADLDRLLDETTHSLLGAVLGARDADELHLAAKRLSKWWEDEVFTDVVTEWAEGGQGAIEDWSARVAELCTRRFDSREFRSALPANGNGYDADRLQHKKRFGPRWWKLLREAVAGGRSRDFVYSVGKFLGVKFRPWGAVKIAGRFAKAAPVLAVLGVAVDGWAWWSSHVENKRREKARSEIAAFVKSSRQDVRQSLLGGDGEETGLAAYLRQHLAAFDELRAEILADLDGVRASLEAVSAERALLQEVIEDGWTRLGGADPEENLSV